MNEDSSYAPHILVVDDDDRLRRLLKKFLLENGYMVAVASNAADARRQMATFQFDLLVVDVMMPGEDGMSLTRDIRKDSTVPILMLTAMGDAPDRIRGLELGVDDYMAKPFEPKELVLRISFHSPACAGFRSLHAQRTKVRSVQIRRHLAAVNPRRCNGSSYGRRSGASKNLGVAGRRTRWAREPEPILRSIGKFPHHRRADHTLAP